MKYSNTRQRILAVEKILLITKYKLKISEIIEELEEKYDIFVSGQDVVGQDIKALLLFPTTLLRTGLTVRAMLLRLSLTMTAQPFFLQALLP